MKMHDYNKDKDRVFLLIHPMMSDGAGLKLCITDHMSTASGSSPQTMRNSSGSRTAVRCW